MSEDNRAAARRWFEEVWNQRNDAAVHELMAPGAVGHMEGGDVHGAEEFLAARANLLRAIPDLRVTVEDTVVEGDRVALRWRVVGTHSGEGLGIPPSGRAADFRGITVMKMANGRMVEGWDGWNMGALLQALSAPNG